MSGLIKHVFNDNKIRTVTIGGDPWFVATDIAEALGYLKPNNAISAHCKGALIQSIPTAGGNQNMNVIPERDVYRLVMRSRLPSAEAFEDWIVGEVIPSIRKTGSYTLDQEPALLTDAAKIEYVDRFINASSGNKGFRATAKALRANEYEFRLFLLENRVMYRLAGEWVPYSNQVAAGRLDVRSGVSKNGHVYLESKFTPKGIFWIAGLWAQYKLGSCNE